MAITQQEVMCFCLVIRAKCNLYWIGDKQIKNHKQETYCTN